MKQRGSFFLVLAALAVMAAVWSALWLAGPRQLTLDERVRNVSAQLKCVVCQGESVADSQADLAQQMRLVIHEQLQAGKSDQEVVQYFVNRYGNQIVWAPPWSGFALLAWLIPIVFLLSGMALVFFVLREWRRATPTVAASTDVLPAKIDDPELAVYRAQLEEELAAEDVLFRQRGMEAR